MAEEFGLANLLRGEALPTDDFPAEQTYAPSSQAIPEGYRMLPLPNGQYMQVYRDISDAEAYARARALNEAWFAVPEEKPKHKVIPRGHAADEERPDTSFEEKLDRPTFDSDEQLRAQKELNIKQRAINNALLATRQVPSAFNDQETPLTPMTPEMEQVAAKRALTEKLAHRVLDAQGPIPQAFQGAPTNADIARANEAMIRPDPEKQGFMPGSQSGAAGLVAGPASAVATNLEALPYPLDEYGQQAASALRGAVAPMRAIEKEAHKPQSELELIEAWNKGMVPGLQAEATHVGDVMGPFLGKWGVPMMLGKAGAPGQAASAGLTYSLMFDEFEQRAKEAKIPLSLPELHAGAAISTALFQLAPAFITKGLPTNLIAPSAKTVAEIYRTQGPEAAQAAIGGVAQNLLKAAGSGFVGATGAMVGTEAAQRQLLGQPQITFDEAAQMAKDAGIMTAFTAPFHAYGSREAGRRAFVNEAARDIRGRMADREADETLRREGVRVDAADLRRQNAQRRWPEMRTEGVQGRDQAQGTTEAFTTPGITEPAPPAPPASLDLTQVPREDIEASLTNLNERSNALLDANDYDAYDALQGAIQLHETELRRRGAEELAAATGKQEEAQTPTPPEGIAPPEPAVPPKEFNPEDYLDMPVEPVITPIEPVTPEAQATAPEAQATAPEAPAPYYETLGLSPKNQNVRNALKSLDIDNPEHHATIVQVLDDAIANPRLKVKDVDAMTALRDQLQPKEVPSAEQIPEAGAPDGGSGPQPILREEGGDQAVSGQGVEPSGQGGQTAEVKTPEEEISGIQKQARSLQPGDIITNDMGDKVEIVKVSGTLKDGTQLYEWRDPDDPNFGPTKLATSSPDAGEGVLSIHHVLSPYTYYTPEGERKSTPGATVSRVQETTAEPKAPEIKAPEESSAEPQNPIEAWNTLKGEGEPEHKELPREAQTAWREAFDDGAADKAFFDQLKTTIPPKAERQVGKVEAEVPSTKEDYDADEFLYSLGEPTPKEELVDRAIQRLMHKEETGQDIWVPGMGNKQVQATLRNLLTQRDAGTITEEQMHGRLNDLLDQITIKAAEKRLKGTPRVRGADFIRQRMLEAKRKGLVSDRAADMAEWFIKKNPALVEDLGISIKGEAPKGDDVTAGFYDKANRVFTLIAENAKDTTSIHETLHHLERMMPANIRSGITKAWTRSLTKARDKALKAGDEPTLNFFNAALTGDARATKKALEGLNREQLGEHYQHFSPSEFWAVNGARILENRYNSSPAFLKRLGTWLREFGQHVKGTLGLESDAPILRAIDTMLKEKAPEYRAERLLAEETGKQDAQFLASREPSRGEETSLVTSERKSMVKAVGNAVKRIVSAAIDPRALSKEYTKFTQQVVAESRGLTKALEAMPTYDPDMGIRADYIRNQYDSAYQITMEGLFGGVPIMERGSGIARIEPTTRMNVDRIMADAAKLPLDKGHDGKAQDPLTVMAEIFRIKLGELERKELTKVVRRLEAIRALPAASRQTKDAKAEIAKLRKLVQEPRERRVTPEMVDWANQQIRDVDGVQDILDRWAETNQHLLAFERDSQFISKERYEELSARTAYIPLFMPMEDVLERRGEMPSYPGGGPKATGKEYTKSGRGSLLAVNVWENMAKRYSAAIANGMMNNTKVRTYEQLKRVGLAERVALSYQGKDAVKARMDGKDFLFRVKDEDAYRSLIMAGMYSNRLLDAFAIPANWLRRSALFLNPAYYGRQVVTEPFTATMTTMAKGALGPVTPIDALYQIGKRAAGFGKSAKEMQSYGITGLSHLDQNMRRFSRAIGETPKFNRWLQGLDKFHAAFDDATRTIIYESAQKEAAKQGITDPQIIKDIAAVKARDFADHAAKGSSQFVRAAAKQTPFLHAHFVGMDKFLRAATGYGKANKEGDEQKQRFINMAVLGASGVIGLTLLNAHDKRYRELPISEWSKSFIVGFDEEGRAIKLPISQEVGFIKFMAELTTRMMMGISDQPEANKAFHGMAIDTLLPPGLADPVSVATRGWLQVQTNTELHSGQPIVSPQELLGLPADQDKRATIFSKGIRDGLKGTKYEDTFSPDMFDSLMRAYGSAAYDNAALIAAIMWDVYQKKAPYEVPFNKDFTEVYPGARVFFSNPRNISDMPRFYDMAKPLYQSLQSFTQAANFTEPEALQRFKEMQADPVVMERVKVAKLASQYRARISDLEKANERLFMDPNLSEPARRKLYWENVERIKDQARIAVDKLTESLQSDEKYRDAVNNSWKLSVTPEDIEKSIGNFDKYEQSKQSATPPETPEEPSE